MIFIHKIICFFNQFKKYPFVRRTAWIHKNAVLQKDTVIGDRTKIKGKVTFGKNVFVGDDCQIGETVDIADNTRINFGSYITTCNANGKDKWSPETDCKIVIGKNVSIGANSIICKGIIIGDNCIILSGARVDFNVPKNSVVQGNPAKIIPNKNKK